MSVWVTCDLVSWGQRPLCGCSGQPHPGHNEDDYFHHPTLPRGSDWKPNMQILPVQTGRRPDIQMMILLLSFLSFSLWSLHVLYIMYTTVESSGPGLISDTSPPLSPYIYTSSSFFPPPWMLKCHWIHWPPTHKPTLHLVIHLVPFHTLSHQIMLTMWIFLSFFLIFFFYSKS